MDKETFEALKRVLSNRYGKTSMQYKSDIEKLENWIDQEEQYQEQTEKAIF